MQLSVYVGLLHTAEGTLAESYRQVASGHRAEADVFHICRQLAAQCDDHVRKIERVAQRYGEDEVDEPERLHAEGLSETRDGPLGLLRDLQDLYLLAAFVDITWTAVRQAAQGIRDKELLDVVVDCEGQTVTQLGWLRTRLEQATPQALLVAE